MPNTFILADEGAAWILKAATNNSFPANKDWELKLYCNDYTPVSGSILSSFTEAVGGGYAVKTLANGSWAQSSVGSIEQIAYTKQTFAFTGVLTTNPIIYGCYIVDKTAGTAKVIGAHRFDNAFQPTASGSDTYGITPIIQMSFGTPAA